MRINKVLPTLAVLAALANVDATQAQQMICIRTTNTYSTTYYYSNGSTMTYTFQEITEHCSPVIE